jgi:hypothetical protein
MAQHRVASLALCHREVSVRWTFVECTCLLTPNLPAGSFPSSPLVANQVDDRHAHLRPATRKQSYRLSLRRPTTNPRTPPQRHQKNDAHPSHHTKPHPPSSPPTTYHARPHPSLSLRDPNTTKTWKPNSRRPSVTSSAAAGFQVCWSYAAARRVSSREKGARRRISVPWCLGSGSRRRARRSAVRRGIWAR